MRFVFCLLTAALFLCFASTSNVVYAQAQNRIYDSLQSLNRQKPLQNPRLQNMHDVLGRDVLDRRSRVVGEVNDVLLIRSGQINSLDVDMTRLGMQQKLFLNYKKTGVRALVDSYSLNIADDQIEELAPALLNDIESSAGQEDVMSLQRLKGARLIAEDGRRLGEVANVLFADKGDRARALYIDLDHKFIRREFIAIPFSAPKYRPKARTFDVVVTNDYADAIIEYAGGR